MKLLVSLLLAITGVVTIATASPTAEAAPTDPAFLEIKLPPTGLAKLQNFKFGDYVCNMSSDNWQPGDCASNGHGWRFNRVTVSNADPNPSETRDDYYVIYVTSFTKGDGFSFAEPRNKFAAAISDKLKSATSTKAYSPPPASFICIISPDACNISSAIPYDYQVTFQGTSVPPATISNYAGYLSNLSLSNAYIGDGNCIRSSSGNYLCMDTQVRLSVPENEGILPLFLRQRLSLGGSGSIQFEGNVGGSGNLGGFGFTSANAVAVGGQVSLTGQGREIDGYTQTPTKLNWSSISGDLASMFAKRGSGTVPNTGNSYNSPVWQLNSSSDNPQSGIKSSFSSPPEGKLWNVNGDLNFSRDVSFNGRGTIAVDGNVNFNGSVSCASNSQVGIIASGSITFGSGANVNCGAFTALGSKPNTTGDITFLRDVTGTTQWEGIFVAKNDIKLPRVNAGTLIIRYNTAMADNPTVLFKELLTIVFSTDS